ncbi:AtpZ/AtpI family protein [Caballeronia sp. AZ1_KS37]|uniref:AtpZ/AtpI family protein n=1 Tax=Caballeronia sp. AZ1_KS37 TaxID=2921756 RepID=UPI002028D938|nr:AtpZ/AtpI family protein [Caballeronia sp. AZ1_KS37]
MNADHRETDAATKAAQHDHRAAADNHTAHAAQRAALRQRRSESDPEPSLGSRFGQIGVLGWAIVMPTLLGLAIGHWLDRRFATRVFFSAPLLMLGACVGLWSAWKWMHRQNRGDRE